MSDIRVFERAAPAIQVALFSMGVPLGVMMARMAEIKQAVGANAAVFGAAMALMGIGTLFGTALASRLIHAFGSRTVARSLFPFVVLVTVGFAFATNIVEFGMLTILQGAVNTAVITALSSQGVLVEQGLRRTFMPKALASWSVGTFSGSALSATAAPYVTPQLAFALTAVLILIVYSINVRWLLPARLDDRPHDDPTQLSRHERIPGRIRRFLIFIATAQSFSVVAEMSVGDWSAVLLREHFGVPVGPNGYGFTVFMFTMILVRLYATRLFDRFGMERVIRTSAIVGALGFTGMLSVANLFTMGSPMYSLAAMCLAYVFLCIGVGAMPAAFLSAVGSIRGLPSARAIALMTAVSAVGNLLLRTGLGALAEAVTLAHALYVVPVIVIGAGLMATLLRPERVDSYAIERSELVLAN